MPRPLRPEDLFHSLETINNLNAIPFLECDEALVYEEEWWHWSFGDSGWALRTGAAHAVYGGTI